MITSPTNPQIKAAAALRQRRERNRTGLFLIEGVVEIERALRASVTIESLYVETGRLPPPAWPGPYVTLGPMAFARIALGRDGVIAVARQPSFDLGSFHPPRPELLLVVEAMEKPGNLGAMLRTADATAAGVMVADPVTDLTNPNVVRASLGTIFTVPLAQASAEEVMAWLVRQGVELLATTVSGGIPPWAHDLSSPVAIAIGSEHQGLSSRVLSHATGRITLPMSGSADSLNAAATAAVMLFEAVRQRSL